jgi:hypothetical protein
MNFKNFKLILSATIFLVTLPPLGFFVFPTIVFYLMVLKREP